MLPCGTRMQECVCGALGVAGVRLTVPMCVYVAIGRSAVWRTQGVVGSAACVWWGLRVHRARARGVRSARYALVRRKSVKIGRTTAVGTSTAVCKKNPMCEARSEKGSLSVGVPHWLRCLSLLFRLQI